MPKVTSKLQLTVPKVIADRYGIRPGDELQWFPAGDVIRVIPPQRGRQAGEKVSVEDRLKLFDKATARQLQRHKKAKPANQGHGLNRGWKREDLYRRGRAD
jgi:bifunctional DNA-binding transcriptional regulator/antitoxin component of YhaV-PrlF toxin-antitoxin module